MDIDKMVDAVTKVIMERLNAAEAGGPDSGACAGKRAVVFGQVPRELVCGGCEVVHGADCADIAGCDYVVMTADSFGALCGGAPQSPLPGAPCAACAGRVIDLTGKRLVHERDLRDSNTQSGDVVRVSKNAIITALAHDYAKSIGAKIQKY